MMSSEKGQTQTGSDQRVAVVLVAWNAASVIAACLESLAGSGHDVVVVDNASGDGTADLVATRFPWVRLIREPLNRGFAGGVNRGTRATSQPIVLFLNCDTVVHTGAIDRLAEVLRRTPRCAAVGGMLVDEHGSPQHGFHVRRFPTLLTWAADLLLLDHVWPGNPATRRYRAADVTAHARDPIDVDQPAAACLMVDREMFEQLNGFDEGFHPAWFEDVDFCQRIHAAGRRILFVPDAVFTHQGGVAMHHLGTARFAWHWYRNLQRYVRKHQGVVATLACKALIVTGMLFRVAGGVAMGRWRDAWAYARVALDAMAYWPDIGRAR